MEFIANNVGDWIFHCHIPHHMMNHMTSMTGPARMLPAAWNGSWARPSRERSEAWAMEAAGASAEGGWAWRWA